MANGKDESDVNVTQEESTATLATEILCELKRQNNRFYRIIIALIAVLIIVIGLFVWEKTQWDYASYEVNSNDGGNANFIGNNGYITNGTSESENETQKER